MGAPELEVQPSRIPYLAQTRARWQALLVKSIAEVLLKRFS